MIEHIARHPRIRDRAVFVGNPDDVVADRFGPGLPLIRDWTREHYDFAGYVTGFDPADVADREALRAELGYGPDERVCVVIPNWVGSEQVRDFEFAGDSLVLRPPVVAVPTAPDRSEQLAPAADEQHGEARRARRQVEALARTAPLRNDLVWRRVA